MYGVNHAFSTKTVEKKKINANTVLIEKRRLSN